MATFDAATNGGQTFNASLTFSHTCTGSDRVLLVGTMGGENGAADDLTSITYSGVTMTLVAKLAGTDRWLYLYLLVAPATGSNNVVITYAGTHTYGISGSSVSYTTCLQTGQPNVNGTEDSVSNVTTLTGTLTTSADNCWLVAYGVAGNGGIVDDGGATSVRRVLNDSLVDALFDSGAAKTPAGAHAITFTGANAHFSSITAAIAPVAGGGGGGGAGVGRRALLGVGR